MRTIKKNLLMASLLLVTTAASAQCVKLEKRMSNLISEYSEELCISKTINEMRDPSKPERPLQSKCEVYHFTIKKKSTYQRELLEEMIHALETEGHNDPYCYSVNSMNGRDKTEADRRRLMIGENTENYIEIGKDYENYWNINVLDTADATKSHRYAYAVEWREKGKNIDIRYIVTYAQIPSANSPIGKTSIFNLGNSRIADGRIESLLGNLRLGNGRLDELLRAESKYWDDVVVDTCLSEELKADTALIGSIFRGLSDNARKLMPKTFSADDLLCDDNILLIFSQLKQDMLAGKNQEFNAISIYNLCNNARKNGFFRGELAKPTLEILKREIRTLLAQDKNVSKNETVRHYLQHALAELLLIK